MEIVIESFLIFTCLMFWIMFYNKKGLLAEIKSTEKKISEKIIVLEDLLDSAHQKSLFSEPVLDQQLNLNMDYAIELSDLKSMIAPDLEPVKLPLLDLSEKTELRILSLENASRLDFIGEDTSPLEMHDMKSDLETSMFSDDGDVDFEPKLSQGVTDKVLEALDNFNKIDVSEPIQIKSFRDVVLMSKKIEKQ